MQEQALTDATVAKSAELTKCRRRFLSHILMLFLSINHRINFTQWPATAGGTVTVRCG